MGRLLSGVCFLGGEQKMALYDKYYIKQDYFGKPYPELLEFFEGRERGSIVDLGAGQGRSSLPLSGMGFSVTAVDICALGLEQIRETDESVITVKADIEDFDVSGFDYILMDSMLHFYARDLSKETNVANNILTGMKNGAVFVNCMMKSDRAQGVFKKLIEESDFEFDVLENKYIRYEEGNCDYHFCAVRKV